MARSKSTSKNTSKLRVETIIHDDATRKNIPTAEYQSILQASDKTPIQVAYERRNRDLDPQLIWRGKDQQDWTDLVVSAPPLYIQEKVHPKAVIDDLLKRSEKKSNDENAQIDLFANFNGLPSEGAKTEFYQHEAHWTNRMILGDSLQVMASLAEREGLRGKVQCIYFDPPYGIKFNSNFQWSTTSKKVEDGKADHITREPEQVKAFRDTWRDGIHSYLTYLRDRFTVARDLLKDSGSIFVQIGDENVHRVRSVLEEVFGASNAGDLILVKKKGGQKGRFPEAVNDYIVWFFKDKEKAKTKQLYEEFTDESEIARDFRLVRLPNGDDSSLSEISKTDPNPTLLKVRPLILEKERGCRLFKSENSTSGGYRKNQSLPFEYNGKTFDPGIKKGNCWKHTAVEDENDFSGMRRLALADRLYVGKDQIGIVRYFSDFGLQPISNWWDGFGGAPDQVYVVQTNERIVERCLLLASDPGDLVLDPTCGSGTTATVAEQLGRRWITIDTSRVALALARARVMGAKYPYYILADSRQGQIKEAELSGKVLPTNQPTYGNIKHGFVYQRRPHITSSVIANNKEIDVIWNNWKPKMDALRESINKNLKSKFDEWEVPNTPDDSWPDSVKALHSEWMNNKKARQLEMDQSIIRKADYEYLYDRPIVDNSVIRVAGPFTVESVSPHRVLGISADEELINEFDQLPKELSGTQNFVNTILENLKKSGVQQAHKDDKIEFISISPWPGKMICAEGRYIEGKTKKEKRAAIFVGPEFGTVSRVDLVDAAKEAGESDFEVLIACAFNFDARSTEFSTLGKIPVLKARMNADLHMAEDLKNTGKGNLFVIFGEPDIEVKEAKDKLKVKIKGVDVFHPNTGEVKSDGADGIACWFIDTDYNEESFFVRHAYFLGASDPYKALKTSLKAEIDKESWDSLYSDTSRPFSRPESGRIAVKVINHLGDEVMKVFKVN